MCFGVCRRSISASQLAHLQDLVSPQPITRLHGSGTIFASPSPKAGHSHSALAPSGQSYPALALASPTNALAPPSAEQGFASHVDFGLADGLAMPSSLLAAPISSPTRTGSIASDAAVSGGWAQRPANRLSTSPSTAGNAIHFMAAPSSLGMSLHMV